MLKIYRKQKHKSKAINEFQLFHKYMIWMEIFAPSILVDNTKVDYKLEANFNQEFYAFLKETPKRYSI